MNALLPVLAVILFAPALFADVGPAAPASAVYREVTGRVFDEAGRPVAGQKVSVMATDRGSIGAVNNSEDEAKARGWDFITDANGRFTARFGKFNLHEHKAATGLIEPGFGHFYFTVDKEGFAGGFSEELLNLSEEERAWRDSQERPTSAVKEKTKESDEHVRPGIRTLADGLDPRPVEIVLKRGISVTGELVDLAGKPIAGEKITATTDLGADTHTGHVGEVVTQTAETNGAGHFHFEHVYPDTFTLQTREGSEPPFWIRTRLRGRWFDKPEDVITPHRGEKSIHIRIVASRTPIFRYFGRVTDAHGRPIADAEVQVHCSMHDPELTYEDGHNYDWRAKTNRDGRYVVRTGYPFADALTIDKDGTRGWADYWEYDDLHPPGRYDIKLER